MNWTLGICRPCVIPLLLSLYIGECRADNLPHYYVRPPKSSAPRRIVADVCIYGGTPAGVTAAIQVARMNKKAVIVELGSHIGGMTASGLGSTDIQQKEIVGGLAREFYERVAHHYENPKAWKAETFAQYRVRYMHGRSFVTDKLALQSGKPTMWTFEPSVAESIFREWLSDAGVVVYYGEPLSRVRKVETKIAEIETERGDIFQAKSFIDATYEGDLMAKAGVSYAVGRESNESYGELHNGVHPNNRHNFKVVIDPFVQPGNLKSGLLPGVTEGQLASPGTGDQRIQAYNFRMCLSRATDRLPFARPPNYRPERYELLARYIRAGFWEALALRIAMPNLKSDQNSFGAISTDHVGANYEWPEADFARREAIFQDHVNYQQGMMYYLAHSPTLPAKVRSDVKEWGLPRDEFKETGGWPWQLYVREARRMVSDYVITEHDCNGGRAADDSVGLADYAMDSHNCQRYAVKEGGVWKTLNEGTVEARSYPYPISYRAIVPSRTQCSNLLVPVSLSASHIAYGSLRMEPVYMILGQSAGTAAVLAQKGGVSLRELPYEDLKDQLIRDRQIISWVPSADKEAKPKSKIPKRRIASVVLVTGLVYGGIVSLRRRRRLL